MDLRALLVVCVALALTSAASCGGREEAQQEEAQQPAPLSRAATLRVAVAGCTVLLLDHDLEELAHVIEREQVASLLDLIEINDAKSGGACRCIGEPCFTFVRTSEEGEEIVAEIRIHHGYRLSWQSWDGSWDGWDGHSFLTERSAFMVCRWLAERGVSGPLRDAEQRKGDLAPGRPW